MKPDELKQLEAGLYKKIEQLGPHGEEMRKVLEEAAEKIHALSIQARTEVGKLMSMLPTETSDAERKAGEMFVMINAALCTLLGYEEDGEHYFEVTLTSMIEHAAIRAMWKKAMGLPGGETVQVREVTSPEKKKRAAPEEVWMETAANKHRIH